MVLAIFSIYPPLLKVEKCPFRSGAPLPHRCRKRGGRWKCPPLLKKVGADVFDGDVVGGFDEIFQVVKDLVDLYGEELVTFHD